MMVRSLIFALVRMAFGLIWLGALVVMWTGFWVGSGEPADVRSAMHLVALVLTGVSALCAVAGWLCGRLLGRRGWLPAVGALIVGSLLIPHIFGEAPRLSSVLVALPIVLPPVAFGFMSGWRRKGAPRR